MQSAKTGAIKNVNLQQLEETHQQLRNALFLPDAILDREAPTFLRNLDLTYTRQLLGSCQPWGKEDIFDENSRIITEVLCASDEGRQRHLEFQIETLQQVKETRQDGIYRGPYGISQAILPIKIKNHIVHCICSNRFHEKPFTTEELKDLAHVAGLSVKKVEEVAKTLPVYSKEQAEELLSVYQRLRDSLTQALEEHLRATDMAAQQLKAERMYSLGSLSEGMAHHLNNLLSIVLGYTSMVLDRGEVPAVAADALKKVAEAAQKGRRFTEEILTIARTQEEQEVLCSVHDRFNGVLTLLQAQLPPTIRVETRLQAKRDTVIAPPAVLHQIIFNLITNALNSMPSGGVLAVTTSNIASENVTELSRDYLKIEVSDTSGVIPKRGDKDPAAATHFGPAGENVGPKLTSIFGLVGRLEGTVTVVSEPGMITRVEILLPVHAAASKETPNKKVRRRLAPSTIWVADDDPVVREMCRRVLTEEGHSVDEIGSGQDLRKRWQETKPAPDLIIYDFSMADYNGF